jgi:predicted porin
MATLIRTAMLPRALLAAGVMLIPATAKAADAISLTLGGRIEEFFFVADQDQAAGEDLNTAGLFNDVRITAEGKTVLDNGISVRSYVRFFAVGRGTADVDEAYVDVSTTFGRLRIGEKSGVNSSIIGDPVPEAFLTVDDELIGDGLKARTAIQLHDAFTFKRFTGNALGISYETPEVFGFKVGVSYHPTISPDYPDPAFPVAPSGTIDGRLMPHNALDASIGYDGAYEGGTYRLAGGYFHLASRTGGNDGVEAWNVSGGLTYGGWEADGAYMHVTPENGLKENDWVVGALYGIGPIQISADYRVATRWASALARERVDRVMLQTAYKLGPGISVGFGGFYATQRDATGANWDSGGVLSGLKIGF